jgi:hypothetical protein
MVVLSGTSRVVVSSGSSSIVTFCCGDGGMWALEDVVGRPPLGTSVAGSGRCGGSSSADSQSQDLASST